MKRTFVLGLLLSTFTMLVSTAGDRGCLVSSLWRGISTIAQRD